MAKGEFGIAFTFIVLNFQNSIKTRLKDLLCFLGMKIKYENKHSIFCKGAFFNI